MRESELKLQFFTDQGQFFDLTNFFDVSSLTLDRRIVDLSFKNAASSLSFSCGNLSKEFIDFLFFTKNKIYVILLEKNIRIFYGILDPFFNRPLLDTSKNISFSVKDFSELLKISFEKSLQIPEVFNEDWLFVFNPAEPTNSVVHILLSHTLLADQIDDAGSERILSKTPALIIKDGEEIEMILSALLYEFGFAYTFTEYGKLQIRSVWKSEVVEEEVQPCTVDASSYVLSKSRDSSYDSTKIVWRTGKFKKKEEAISTKKPIWSASTKAVQINGKIHQIVAELRSEVGSVWPKDSEKAGSEILQTYDPTWLDTNYEWNYEKKDVFFNKYAANKELGIVATYRPHLVFQADSGIDVIRKEFFPDKVQISFKNILPKTPNVLQYLKSVDVYADIFYTFSKNEIKTKKADEFLSKKFEYSTRFIFDEKTAKDLFNFLTNLRIKGNSVINFTSIQDIEVARFVSLNIEEESIDQYFLVLSKKIKSFDKDRKFFEYECINWGAFIFDNFVTTSTEIGREEKSKITEVLVAAFDSKNKDVAKFVAKGVRDEKTFYEAISFAHAAGVNKIRLLDGNFFVSFSIDFNNFEIDGGGAKIHRIGALGNLLTAKESLKLKNIALVINPFAELVLSGELSKPFEDFLTEEDFLDDAALILNSSIDPKHEAGAALVIEEGNLFQIENVTFSNKTGVGLRTRNIQNLIINNSDFSLNLKAFEMEEVNNLTFSTSFLRFSESCGSISASNVSFKDSEINNNATGLLVSSDMARFSNNVVSENKGVALEVFGNFFTSSGNIFSKNETALKLNLDATLKDVFIKNDLGLMYKAEIYLADFNSYQENVKVKEEF